MEEEMNGKQIGYAEHKKLASEEDAIEKHSMYTSGYRKCFVPQKRENACGVNNERAHKKTSQSWLKRKTSQALPIGLVKA